MIGSPHAARVAPEKRLHRLEEHMREAIRRLVPNAYKLGVFASAVKDAACNISSAAELAEIAAREQKKPFTPVQQELIDRWRGKNQI
jgi:hypothetical protein